MVEKTRFAWQSFFLLAATVACILILNILKRHELIEAHTEGLLRLILNSTLGSILLWLSYRAPIGSLLKTCIFVALGAALAETFFDYTEDVAAWNNVPIIGRNCPIRNTLESVLGAGWMAGGFCTIFVAIKLVRKSQLEADGTIDRLVKSENKLRSSNEQLATALADLKATQKQLIQRERLSAIGQMASGIAHDLNNSLTPAMLYSNLLLDKEFQISTEDRESYMDCIQQSTQDAVSTIKGLQRFYEKPRQDNRNPIDLCKLISQVLAMTRPKWKDEPEMRGIRVDARVEAEKCPPIRIDETQLRVVLTNLIFNAVEAMPNGGTITITLSLESRFARLSVSDDGLGMSEEMSRCCFEPFFTSKERGSGLGLSVCHGIVSGLGGTISVSSRIGQGTEFQLSLPLDPSPLGYRQSKRAVARQIPCSLLLVDDDERVRTAIATMLEDMGATVVQVADGRSALEILAEAQTFDAIITDLGMADVDGCAVVEATRSYASDAVVAVISGWSESDIQARLRNVDPPNLVIQKPPTSESLHELLELVRQHGGTAPAMSKA